MPIAGSRLSEETRKKISDARKRQPSQLIGRNGVTKEIYDAAKAAGKIWCRECKKFCKPEEFGKGRSRCLPCNREKSAYYRAQYKQDPEAYGKWRQQIRDAQAKDHDLPNRVRKKWMRVRYGVTPEWYQSKLEEQGGGCALCGGKADSHGGVHFCIDHDHKTKTTRGLLCHRCNVSLERVEGIEGWLTRAAEYLAQYRNPQ